MIFAQIKEVFNEAKSDRFCGLKTQPKQNKKNITNVITHKVTSF